MQTPDSIAIDDKTLGASLRCGDKGVSFIIFIQNCSKKSPYWGNPMKTDKSTEIIKEQKCLFKEHETTFVENTKKPSHQLLG